MRIAKALLSVSDSSCKTFCHFTFSSGVSVLPVSLCPCYCLFLYFGGKKIFQFNRQKCYLVLICCLGIFSEVKYFNVFWAFFYFCD